MLFAVLRATICVLQEPSDAVNSLNVRIDIGLANPGTSPVLDTSSPASVAYSVSTQSHCWTMHCYTLVPNMTYKITKELHTGKNSYSS